MPKREIRELSPQEVQDFHNKMPVAFLEDGVPRGFFLDQGSAQYALEAEEAREAIEKKLEEFVLAAGNELKLSYGEVYLWIHAISEEHFDD